MKISYRNQAILKMLSTGIMGPVAIHLQDKDELTDELLAEFGKLWKINAESFNADIKILSLPFAEAVIQSADKLSSGDLLEKALIENTCGTLIINDRTICYSFESSVEKVTELTYFLFKKSPTEMPELRCFIYAEFNEQNLSANAHSYFAKSGVYKNDTSLSIEMCIKTLIATLNFIKYADIEVKLLPANKIVKDIRCKYVNETSSNIQYLNSTWFTTLIKSDAFKVRGHFRLQPKKKDGVWTKELKWINEFEKTGYTSLAKKKVENHYKFTCLLLPLTLD